MDQTFYIQNKLLFFGVTGLFKMVSHGRSSNGESSNRTKSSNSNACSVKELSEEDLRIKRTLANRRERQRTEVSWFTDRALPRVRDVLSTTRLSAEAICPQY